MQAAKQKAPVDKALIAFRVPGLENELIAENSAGAGKVFGQGKAQKGGAEGLFDDIAGRGFKILSRDGDALSRLPEDQRRFWAGLGGDSVSFGVPGTLTDLDGNFWA